MRKLLALWIRLHHTGAAIAQRRMQERALAQLDARTLKDIGLEPWRSALGARVEQFRRERVLWSNARLGMY